MQRSLENISGHERGVQDGLFLLKSKMLGMCRQSLFEVLLSTLTCWGRSSLHLYISVTIEVTHCAPFPVLDEFRKQVYYVGILKLRILIYFLWHSCHFQRIKQSHQFECVNPIILIPV